MTPFPSLSGFRYMAASRPSSSKGTEVLPAAAVDPMIQDGEKLYLI